MHFIFVVIGTLFIAYGFIGLFKTFLAIFSMSTYQNIPFQSFLFSTQALKDIGFLAVTFASGVYIAQIGAEDNNKKTQEQSQ